MPQRIQRKRTKGWRMPKTIRWELAGHDLVCWCPLDDGHGNRVPCHADVLLELAAREDI